MIISPNVSNGDASVFENKLKVIITPGTRATLTFTIAYPELVDQTLVPITTVTNDMTNQN
ncbi:hypothetical protein [Lysinibacillus fusiformis]|uniref:hypothetical protein n=1 Tax=Lysinibacillus fusiformis TaxID=28031 RepID=UPI00382C9647